MLRLSILYFFTGNFYFMAYFCLLKILSKGKWNYCLPARTNHSKNVTIRSIIGVSFVEEL